MRGMTHPGGRFLRRRSRRRKVFFSALLILSIILVSILVARVISANTVRLSIRPQLSVLIEGAPFTIPSGVGINQSLWRDHSLDNYGVSGHSPLTTRDSSGIIFVESNSIRDFTLREFLAVWGQTVDISQVVGNPVPSGYSSCMAVNGQTLPALQDVILSDNERIALEIVRGDCSAVS
jgi:hypothetical protein